MIHVAVLMRQYLDLILSGAKTVECRLTRQARAPFEAIEPGQRIYFKQSAGPYAATAIAGQVLYEQSLSPHDVQRIKRDYNHLVLGEAAFWRYKRDSRFVTLIWLEDVQPIDHGPAIRPLQGVAWLPLQNDPAWRRMDAQSISFSITLTAANLRYGTVYVSRVLDRFPRRCIGGPTRAQAATPITFELFDGPTIECDIVGPKRIIRARNWTGWFKRHRARAGDAIVMTPVDQRIFRVGLIRR